MSTKANMAKNASRGRGQDFKAVNNKMPTLDVEIDLYYFVAAQWRPRDRLPRNTRRAYREPVSAKAAPVIDMSPGGNAVEFPKTFARAVGEVTCGPR